MSKPTVGTVAVVGGGIAGVSAGYALTRSQACERVLLLETEGQLAFHSTGRSAALFIENYGTGPVRPLTTASLDFFHNPPSDLVDHPLISPRGILTIATEPTDYAQLEHELRNGAAATKPVVEIDLSDAAELAPHIVFGPEHRVMWEANAYDIDVAGLHQAYVRGFRRSGGEVFTSRRLDAAQRMGSRWTLETTTGPVEADVIVNAGGAWGDQVAASAGITPVGLSPRKRTAFMVSSPFPDSAHYPFVAEVHHSWYLGPDGNQFLCSPADEAPSEPCDAKADELDIARTIEMINANTRLGIRSVNSHWAGLRTFAPDRSMVVGPDPTDPTFIWCVGQGGTGIQTSPGAGQLIADLVVSGQPGPLFDDIDLDQAALLPDRLR